ncbi:hypothetical protein DRV85_04035 [Rhodosalinus halophilus]|uniref:Cell division and transport-associated protein TolA n=1 Tax=Rhodosalinus halophilus TaxID=2259333 RepID=A0A365UC45_9RHOB|nr:cell envelope integrity protein TolA [Rhodosalinus halophilus]RBI86608.1 hypothetical protein DRV85_04035 [Rhodosalinus halophilus]
MHVGHYISGAGHLLLLGWAFLGGAFESEPLPMEVAEVTLVSGEDYAALVAPETTPEVSPGVTELETPSPAPDAPAPETPEAEAPPPRPAPPETAAEPSPDETPAPPEPLTPAPEVATPDAAPELAPPADSAVLLPEDSPRPQPRPADRVAPTPAPPPPPEAETAPDPVPSAEPSPEAAPEPEPTPEAAAPEEAAPEIVTEAEDSPGGAPLASLRPQTRPARPAPAAQPATPETAEADEAPEPERPLTEADREATQEAVDQLLSEALGGGESAPSAGAPPLSLGERDALRVAVQNCWVVDVGSQAANVTVVLGMEMNPDGTVVDGSLNLISAEGGSGRAVETAFQAARRAVLRCEQGGYDLPEEKYEHWQRIEMVFDPSEMRLR